MLRIPFDQMHQELKRILLSYHFSPERADLSARIFVEASRDGVYSHGLNRFPRYISYIQKAYIKVDASPVKTAGMGMMEQYDGQLGPGNLNAWQSMERCIALAKTHGMGLVALRNTNHWMRGGAYGWQAADHGLIGICFTNTQPNMPPWGAKEPTLGNNPLIIALPRKEGNIVLDTAMTQFSFGKMGTYKLAGKMLPIDGGYDTQGNLTRDPAEILETWRPLPFGFWKGSGLSLVLDLMASALAGGMSTTQIGEQGPDEFGLSQLFMAIDPFVLGNEAHYEEIVKVTLEALHKAEPVKAGEPASYPGERTLRTRQDHMENGIIVDEGIWEEVLGF